MEDYSKYTNEELLKMYEESVRLAQTYHISQLVKKVLLNSLYGALGNNHFLLYTHEMARGITLMGRCLIRKAAFAKNKYISKILKEKEVKDRLIYGDTDSCVRTTNIVVNDTLMTMEDFYNNSVGTEVKNINDKFVKQLSSENNYTTLSLDDNDVVTTNINYVMKHKVKKHLWKIIVDGKEVVVTDNHSIMFIRDDTLMKGSVEDLRSGDVIVTINKK